MQNGAKGVETEHNVQRMPLRRFLRLHHLDMFKYYILNDRKRKKKKAVTAQRRLRRRDSLRVTLHPRRDPKTGREKTLEED